MQKMDGVAKGFALRLRFAEGFAFHQSNHAMIGEGAEQFLGPVGIIVGVNENMVETEHQIVRNPLQDVDSIVAHRGNDRRTPAGLNQSDEEVIKKLCEPPTLDTTSVAQEVEFRSDEIVLQGRQGRAFKNASALGDAVEK